MKITLTIDVPKHLHDYEMRDSVVRLLGYVGNSIDEGQNEGRSEHAQYGCVANWAMEQDGHMCPGCDTECSCTRPNNICRHNCLTGPGHDDESLGIKEKASGN